MEVFVMNFGGDEEPEIPPAKPITEDDVEAAQKLIDSLTDDPFDEENPNRDRTAKWQRKDKVSAATAAEDETSQKVAKQLEKDRIRREKMIEQYEEELLRFEMELAAISVGESNMYQEAKNLATEIGVDFDRLLRSLYGSTFSFFGRMEVSPHFYTEQLRDIRASHKAHQDAEATGWQDPDLEAQRQYLQFHNQQAAMGEQYQFAMANIRMLMARITTQPSSATLAQMAQFVAYTPGIDTGDLMRLGFNVFIQQHLVLLLETIQENEGDMGIVQAMNAIITIYSFTYAEFLGDVINYAKETKDTMNPKTVVPNLKKALVDIDFDPGESREEA